MPWADIPFRFSKPVKYYCLTFTVAVIFFSFDEVQRNKNRRLRNKINNYILVQWLLVVVFPELFTLTFPDCPLLFVMLFVELRLLLHSFAIPMLSVENRWAPGFDWQPVCSMTTFMVSSVEGIPNKLHRGLILNCVNFTITYLVPNKTPITWKHQSHTHKKCLFFFKYKHEDKVRIM